mgnify:CR=1 FL=1
MPPPPSGPWRPGPCPLRTDASGPTPVTSLELAQFCATRLGRTPPLKDWSQVTHGEFLALAAGLMG